MGSTVMERTATPSFTETDARAAVAAIVAAEGLPAPESVLMHDNRPGRVYVRLADRDAVDDWAAMLGVDTYRAAYSYSMRWDAEPMHRLLPGVVVEFFCDMPKVRWQPRTSVVTA